MSSGNRSPKRGLTLDDLMPITYEDEDDDYAEKPSIISSTAPKWRG